MVSRVLRCDLYGGLWKNVRSLGRHFNCKATASMTSRATGSTEPLLGANAPSQSTLTHLGVLRMFPSYIERRSTIAIRGACADRIETDGRCGRLFDGGSGARKMLHDGQSNLRTETRIRDRPQAVVA